MITTHQRPPRAAAESLDGLVSDLMTHTWSHTATNYRDYIRAVKQEDVLFARAMTHSVAGLDAFRQAKEDSIMAVAQQAVRQAENALVEHFTQQIEALKRAATV